MVTKDQASSTYLKAREFYKGGSKSSNKSYYGTGHTADPTPFSFGYAMNFKIDIEPGRTLTEKQKNRNEATLQNMQTMHNESRTQSQNTGKTPYELGAELFNQNNTRGNCGEMAAVAVYIAVAEVHIPTDEVSFVTLTNTVEGGFFSKNRSFGHSFALLGKVKPDRWVVDPWAGVCCRLSEYTDALNIKLHNWTQQGKRIACHIPDGHCWVEPTNDMVTGILAKSAKYLEVGATQKGQ